MLAQGAIQVMLDRSIGFSQLPVLLQSSTLFQWLPGAVFAVVLLWVSRRYDHFLTMPLSLAIAVGGFYLFLGLTQTSIAEAIAQGWLFNNFGVDTLWRPLNFLALGQVNWSAVSDQILDSLTIVIISPILILLTATSLELIIERDVDLNHELKVAGLANLLSGLGGGMVGYHAFSDSMLAYQMGARSRLLGVFTGVLCAGVLFLGASALSYFPKPVLGGLLLFLGLSLLVEWVYDAWFKLLKSDYAVVIIILVVVATLGFLQGIAAGLVVAVVLFLINYSRVGVTKHELSGATHQSHVERPLHQKRSLLEKGEQIYILELQGFIFFGTANRLLNQVRQRINQSTQQPVKFVVLDFRHVTGLDSSAVISFIKMKQTPQKEFYLVLTNLQSTTQALLERGGCIVPNDPICQIFADLDRRLEWCESQMLESMTWRRSRFTPMLLQLQRLFSDPEQASAFMPYLEKQQISAGEVLFQQGFMPGYLYFLESGQISLMRELEDHLPIRLQTLNAGTVVGEIAFHTQTAYDSAATANQPSTLYCLSVLNLHLMQHENPQTATVFQEFMITLLAERLTQAQKEIKNLLA